MLHSSAHLPEVRVKMCGNVNIYVARQFVILVHFLHFLIAHLKFQIMGHCAPTEKR